MLEAVVEGGIAAVAVAVSVVQVASITVAKASPATGAESSSVQAEESHEAVAEAATEATLAAAVVAGVGPVPETGSNGMEAARDKFRNHLSGARVTTTTTATTTMGTKITREVAGGMAKEAVAVDKSYLEPTRLLLLRSDLA